MSNVRAGELLTKLRTVSRIFHVCSTPAAFTRNYRGVLKILCDRNVPSVIKTRSQPGAIPYEGSALSGEQRGYVRKPLLRLWNRCAIKSPQVKSTLTQLPFMVELLPILGPAG
jgi:hypothetical protein